MKVRFREHRPDSPLAGRQFNQGDIVTTMISCANGETILLTHDCTLPRPYSRGGQIQGTRGIWMENNRGIYLEGHSPTHPGEWAHRWESDKEYMQTYKHPLWKACRSTVCAAATAAWTPRAACLHRERAEGRQTPIDVYDTAARMVIAGEQSVAMGGQPVPVPDFTDGLMDQPRRTGYGHVLAGLY